MSQVVRTFRSARRAGLKACTTSGMTAVVAIVALTIARAQTPAQPDWKALEPEMMQQFQAVLRLDNEVFKALEAAGTRVYHAITLPTMSTGATDMAQLRAKGVQCYGIGSATDFEDPPKGFGAHSDQERILEAELYRFVHMTIDLARALAGARR